MYELRTSAVRLLWVFACVPALHTGPMPVAGAATAFITGADGFVGTALIRVLRGLGHPVFALARSSDAAESLVSGATPVIGDLRESGVGRRSGADGSSISRRIHDGTRG